MKALYITSVEPFSGKTAMCLALGQRLLADGYQVGYLKPVSTQPWRSPECKLCDQDAVFVMKTLGIEGDPSQLSPVIVTDDFLQQRLERIHQEDLIENIKLAAEKAAEGKDLLLLEGGASLREGYAMGLSTLRVAESLGVPALVLVKYRGKMRCVDDALTARFRLADQLMGVICNQVPEEATPFIQNYICPYLEREGVHMLGMLPTVPQLSALSLAELVDLLQAKVLTETFDPQTLVETFTVGAMTAEAALSRFRRYQNKAVITGGDRTDIQLAALETSTTVLILTGNLHPSPLIIRQAEELNVPILLVNDNTMETVNAVEQVYGKTHLGHPDKLKTFLKLVSEKVDLARIYEALELS